MSGLRVERYFTQEGVDPLSQVSYKRVSVREVDRDGRVTYTVDAEVPDFWSDQSAEIVAKKYFRRAGVNGGGETSVKQVVERLVDYWTYWGKRYGYFATDKDAQAFRDEMAYMLIHQIAAPNSPQFFNSGLALKYGITGKNEGRYYYDVELGKVVPAPDTYTHPQASACFLTEVRDDLLGEGGIYDALKVEATIFKAGAGSGANYSYLRGKGEPLSGGGTSSGMMSFLRLFDVGGGVVKSGGVTRRAARMVVVDADHPEILEFARWKAEEEEKAEALASAGYDTGFEGPVYSTISGQSANNSIRVFDKFFKQLDDDGLWALIRRTDGKVHKFIKAKELWDAIVQSAWRSADPGLHFATTINEWNPVPNDGEIRTSNPCSEVFALDGNSCNLASLRLTAFYDWETREFNLGALEHAARLWTIMLDITVKSSSYPTERIAWVTNQYNLVGLGITDLGGLVMGMGLPYDSDAARQIGGALMAVICAVAWKTSAELSRELGAYPRFEANREHHLRVIRNHLALACGRPEDLEGISHPPLHLDPEKIPTRHRGLVERAKELWREALQMGEAFGYRNASVTAVAPTGTISYWLGAQTTGVEPDFALVKVKMLAGGGSLSLVNQMVPRALEHLGYAPEEIEAITAYIREKGYAEGAPGLKEEHVAVFDTAVSPWGTGRFVSVEGHLKMQSAIQAFTSMGISKTVNLPKDTPPEEIGRIYRLAHELGLKSISIYRDGCKLSQVLNVAGHEEKRYPVSLPDVGTVWLDDVHYQIIRAIVAPQLRGGWEKGQAAEKGEEQAFAQEGQLFTSCDLKAGCPE